MTSISTKKEETNERGGKSCWAGRKVGNTNSERTSQLTHNRPPTNNTCSILSVQPVHDQGAALGESNQQQYKSNWAGLQRWPHQSHWHCGQSSELITGEAERPNLTWLHTDHSHQLEKQVEMIYLSLVVNLSAVYFSDGLHLIGFIFAFGVLHFPASVSKLTGSM